MTNIVVSGNDEMRLSDHFTLQEFEHSQVAERLCIPNIIPKDLQPRAVVLCERILEPIRAHYMLPIIISSGYRSMALNEAIGGSVTSQHMSAEAADIIIPGIGILDLCQYVASSGLPFDQLIYEGSWCHVSYRTDRQRGDVLTAIFKPHQHVRYLKGLV